MTDKIKKKRTKPDPVTPYGTKSRTTRSKTLPKRLAVLALAEEEARERAEALRKRREEDLKSRPPAPPGNRGDGQFHAAFIRMGQGDCSIFTTPTGRVIVIDCGSDATEGEDDLLYTNRVHGVLYGEKFLKNQDEIDILILTHPDSDHYNKLETMFGKNVKIHNVYHSSFITSFSVAQTSAWIKQRVTDEKFIKGVTHFADSSIAWSQTISLNGKPVAAADEKNKIDRLDDSGGIRIVDEPSCKITILASNVNWLYTDDSSNYTNRGSVVTLIEAFDKKLLICGDATRNTEQYLLNTNAARIADMTIAQAPHHGSNNTSSSNGYVDKVNAHNVVISAGKQVAKDHLPSLATIERFIARQNISGRVKVADHEVFYWAAGAYNSYYHESKFIKNTIYITGSRDTFFWSVGGGI